MSTGQKHTKPYTQLPDEVLLLIPKCLFEDERGEVRSGDLDQPALPHWPIDIFQTCRVLNTEAKKAMKARLNECGLHYIFGHPPKARSRHDDAVYRQQIKFFSKYGDCIKAISLYHFGEWANFSLHWFPKLEVLELLGSSWPLEAHKHDAIYVDGRLNKDRLQKLFQDQYCGWLDGYYHRRRPRWWKLVRATTKGVDRSFTILIVLELCIIDVGSWVRSPQITRGDLRLTQPGCMLQH